MDFERHWVTEVLSSNELRACHDALVEARVTPLESKEKAPRLAAIVAQEYGYWLNAPITMLDLLRSPHPVSCFAIKWLEKQKSIRGRKIKENLEKA